MENLKNDDRENVALAKKKDKNAIQYLYEKHYRDVYYTCFQYVKDEETAKDLTQDAFVKAFEKIDDLRENEKFKSWVCQIAGRMSLNYLKRENIIDFSSMDDEENEDMYENEISYENEKSPEEVLVEKEVADVLLQAINKLPKDQSLSVIMFYYESLSVKEIAERFECSENTIRGKLRYAQKNLRKLIENLEDEGIKLKAIALLPFLNILFETEKDTAFADISVPVRSHVEKTQVAGKEAFSSIEEADMPNIVSDKVTTSPLAEVAGKTSHFALQEVIKIGAILAITALTIGLISGIGEKNKEKERFEQLEQEKENYEDEIYEYKEPVDTENEYVNGRAFFNSDPVNIYGKCYCYIDKVDQSKVFVNIETNEELLRIPKDYHSYEGSATDILAKGCYNTENVIINLSDTKGEDVRELTRMLYIIAKDASYAYSDTMYVGDEVQGGYSLDFYADDHLTLNQEKYLVYLSGADNKFTLKSVNVEDGSIYYEKEMPKGYVYSKSEQYLTYYDTANEEILVINADNGELIKGHDTKKPRWDIRIVGDYYVEFTFFEEHIGADEVNRYLTGYKRYDVDGNVDVNLTFSKEERVVIKDIEDGGRGRGAKYLLVEKRDGDKYLRGIVTSDFTEVVPISEENEFICVRSDSDANVYLVDNNDRNKDGYCIFGDGEEILEFGFMGIGNYDSIIPGKVGDDFGFINQKNGKYFTTPQRFLESFLGMLQSNNDNVENKVFYGLSDEPVAFSGIYDKDMNLLYETNYWVDNFDDDNPPTLTWNDKLGIALSNDYENSMNVVSMYSDKDKKVKEITTDNNVRYAYMLDKENMLYISQKETESGDYVYYKKNITTGEEVEVYRGKYGSLYGYSEDGFIVGEDTSKLQTVDNFEIVRFKK